MLIDTHCHLTMLADKKYEEPLLPEHDEEIDDVVWQANESGVEIILSVATTLPDTLQTIRIAQRHPGVFVAAGIHPCDCKENWHDDFKKISELVRNKEENKIVGVGETGLDFYHQPFFKQRQLDAFKAHIELALEHNLALSIHMREAVDEALKVMESYKGQLRGVAHCFSQSRDVAKTLEDWGVYIGIGGPLTYPKNDELRQIIAAVSLEQILLETDAPFLTPQQFRGQPNHPCHITIIARAVALVKGVDVAVVEDTTTASAQKLFGFTK